MSAEIWKAYRPIAGLESVYYIRAVYDTHQGLEMLFAAKGGYKGIKIIFEKSYEAYRCIEEGARYKTLCDLHDRYGDDLVDNNCLFIVEHSSFVQWLVSESCEVLEARSLIHFAFLSIDYYVDVVAAYHPKIVHVDIP